MRQLEESIIIFGICFLDLEFWKKVEKKYNNANRGKIEFEKEQLRLQKVEERKQKRAVQMVESIKNNVESVFDAKSGKTYYRTLRTTLCH